MDRNKQDYLRATLLLLRRSRDTLKFADSPRALARVRAAIKSTEGALRHAEALETRARMECADLRGARDAEGDPLDGDNMDAAECERYNSPPCGLCQNKEHGAEDCPYTDSADACTDSWD